MQLNTNEIHVWSAHLTITSAQAQQFHDLLTADERQRAAAFRAPHHQRRFIAARGILRQLLSKYTNIPAADIRFGYHEHKKPYLILPANSPISFNLAHSEEIAVYAITLNQSIGIDIEQIQSRYTPGIAHKYFSAEENHYLNHLPDSKKISHFYRLWARKEALIKAAGKGLSIPLASFTVSSDERIQEIWLENRRWYLYTLAIDSGFQSAIACEQPDMTIKTWDFFTQKENQ